MDHLFFYSYLFKRSQTFFGRLSTHELHVWLNALDDIQSNLAYQTDLTFGEALITCKEASSKLPKTKTHDFVGAPLPKKLRLLQPSAEKQSPASGILKAPCSDHVNESAVCSTHDRHVTWGEFRVQHIDKIGLKSKRQKHSKHLEDREKRLLLQHVLEKDAQFYQQRLSSDPRFAAELYWYDAKESFVELIKHLPSVEDVIKGILQHKPNLELYHASFVLLSSPTKKMLRIMQTLHLSWCRRPRIYPIGSMSKNNFAVNSAFDADLLKELKNARRILQLTNQGQRVYVHWKRLAEDSEARRLYVKDSENKEVAPEDNNVTSKQASKSSSRQMYTGDGRRDHH